MKNKIFAVILTICLLFSTMSMTALANETVTDEIVNDIIIDGEVIDDEIVLQETEDEEFELQAVGVTATVGASNLTNATDVAISFKSIITFPQAIAADTDLSGIVFTGGEEDLAPDKITKGAATDGFITKIEVATPVLAPGTTYTLVVPALGDNEAASFNFTTVDAPYIVKEEFNGRYNSVWGTKLGRNDIASETYLSDTNSDGVKDIMIGNSGDWHNTLWFPTRVPVTDLTQLVIETRVKYVANNAQLVRADGSIKDDNNGDNGGLLVIRGNGADNNSFEVRTNADGYLTYGGSFGRGKLTDYKIYNDKWYTIRLALAADEGGASLYITDDEGNSYQGPSVTSRYGGSWPIDPISDLRYSYGLCFRSDVDYVHVFANDYLDEVSATYDNNIALDGATNVPGRSIGTTLKFENDVTLDQLSALRINKGATLTPTLLDSKTVDIRISNLQYETNYVLDIPQFGNNKAKTFQFKTEPAPEPFEDGEYAFVLADGTSSTTLTNVRTDAYIEYAFDADLLATTPNAYKNVQFTDDFGNAVTANYSLGTNGKYIAYPTKGLKYGTTYTFKCPIAQTSEDGSRLYKVFTFTTEAAPFVVDAYPVAVGGSNAMAIATITDNTGLNNKVKAMLVVYDAEGKIIKITAQDIVLTAGINNINLTATAPGADTAKFYIWGGANGMSNLVSVQ